MAKVVNCNYTASDNQLFLRCDKRVDYVAGNQKCCLQGRLKPEQGAVILHLKDVCDSFEA